MKKYVDKDKLQEYTTKLTNKYKFVFATKSEVGSPLKASTVAEMTDENRIYVYTGSESGYTAGNWYYYDGSAWTSGGIYNSTAFETDNTLAVPGMAADAKAAGDQITSAKSVLLKTCNVRAITYTLYVSSNKYYYFNITKFQESTSKKYLSTRYVNNLNSIIAFDLRSNDFQYNVFYFDETGAASTSSATGYIGNTGYKTGIQFLPKEAKKFVFTFRRADGNAISIEDQTTIMSNLYAYYSVDTSLTEANVAADAKETGDFITNVLDYSAQGVQDGLWIRYNTINKIKKGTTIEINTTLTSGTARDVVWYKHNTNEENLIGYEKFGVGFVYTATEDTTVFTGYLRNGSNAVITSTLKTHGIANHEERIDALEDTDLTIPSYAITTIESIYTKLMALQNSKSATIAMLTDVHVAGANLSDKTQKALLRSMRSLNSIANHNPIDFMVFNGDYLYNGETQTKSATIAWYKQLAETIHKSDLPYFIGKGNHDVNDIDPDGDQYLTDEELYQQFLKYSTLPYVGNYGYLEKAYGYYDIPQKKIRCLFINTVDVPFEINNGEIVYPQQNNTGISNEQLNFIADALDISDDGWGVVIFSHHALQTSDILGTTNSRRLNPDMGGTQLLGVLNAFKNKTTYSNSTSPYNVSADYTHNGSDEIICMISGHIHADRTDVVNGIRMITSMASSFVYTSYDNQGQAVTRTADTISETSWDIFTIDRANEKIYATRYGLGEDREFTY